MVEELLELCLWLEGASKHHCLRSPSALIVQMGAGSLAGLRPPAPPVGPAHTSGSRPEESSTTCTCLSSKHPTEAAPAQHKLEETLRGLLAKKKRP